MNRFAVGLGIAAVVVGLVALGLDLYRGEGLSGGAMASTAVGMAVIAVARRKGRDPR